MKTDCIQPDCAFTAFACRKSDNPRMPELTRVPVPKPDRWRPAAMQLLTSANPAGFKAVFDVGLLFPEDVKPQKMDVVVRKNGAGPAKLVKAEVSTWPTTVQVTGTTAHRCLWFHRSNWAIFFDFAVDIYLSNGAKSEEAFPATGVQFSGGTANIPGSSISPCCDLQI